MLSFDTIHVLTGQLVDESLSRTAPALVVIHDGPAPDGSSATTHAMQVQRAPLGDLNRWRTGVPGLLTDLRDAILNHTASPHLRLIAQAVTHSPPGMRLTAIAVHYTDIATTGDQIGPIERVDAVDIDGRVYQVTRYDGGNPWVVIDATPDPDDLPATQPGLAAILATIT
jgi:hypothetical protein